MPGSVGEVYVRGLPELNRAFKSISKDLGKEMRAELVQVGEPVRSAAEVLAVENISHIGDRWSRMRLGVTSRSVYVAPKARRRRGSSRPNLAPLLAKEMEAALERNTEHVVAGLEHMIDRLGGENGF